jgi:uncharacterized SAM-dependent methyltransferase
LNKFGNFVKALLNILFGKDMSFSNLAQDFMDLFSGVKRAHLAKYVHLYRPDIYDAIVNSETYYIPKLEELIIEKYSGELAKNLSYLSNLVEIGPGSFSPVVAKTVPVISALKKVSDIEYYSAIDINHEYSDGACQIVGERFKWIKTRSIVYDFLANIEEVKLQFSNLNSANKAIICLGGTIFCNNSDEDLDNYLTNISSVLCSDEYFILGVDTSSNKYSLDKAYNTENTRQLLLNAMYGMKAILNLYDFDASAFDLVFEYNEETTTVELYLCATKNQSIKIKDQEFIIEKNNKYNIINSKKVSINYIDDYLKRFDLNMVNYFAVDDKYGNQCAILKIRKN